MSDDDTWSGLSTDDLERVFREEIVPERLANGARQESPVLVIVAGQPGAGKTRCEESARAELNGQAVTIDADIMRLFHPEYAAWAIDDDLTAAVRSHDAAQRWVKMAISYCIAENLNVVLSVTFGNPVTAVSVIEQFRSQGFEVRLVCLAVHEAFSRLGVLIRYQAVHAKTGAGRYVPLSVQDQAYPGLLDTVEAIGSRKLVDDVRVYDQDKRPVYRARRGPDGVAPDLQAVRQHIEAERSQSWTGTQIQKFCHDAAHLESQPGFALRLDLRLALQCARQHLMGHHSDLTPSGIALLAQLSR